ALIVCCTSRKTIRPETEACAVSLPRSSQGELETAWLQRLRALPYACPAAELYAGRGFRLAQQTACAINAPLFIISAGLGLVAGDQCIPTYGLTISGSGPESVGGQVLGRFDSAAWWRAVSNSAFATPLAEIFDRAGLVLMALTRPYAQMLRPAIEA